MSIDLNLLALLFAYFFIELLLVLFNRIAIDKNRVFSRTVIWDLFSFAIVVLGLGFSISNIFTFGAAKIVNAYTSNYRLDFFVDSPMVIKVAISIILYDFLSYWRHRFFHSHRIWWIAHNFHHSSLYLTPLSGFRNHPIQNFFSNMLVGLPMLVVLGFDFFTLLPVFLLSNISSLFTHGRIDTSLGWIGRHIFVTPRYHHLHHAISGSTHCNFGDIFVFWDKLFGTYRAPDVSIHKIQTGIEDNYFEKENMIVAFFKTVWLFYREAFLFLISYFPKKTLAE